MATVTLKGSPVHTNGELPGVGDQAPDFVLVNSSLDDISLKNFAGKRKLINIIPSLDTPLCAESARMFNYRAGLLDNVAVLVVSADLPFAQQRFCSTEGVDKLSALSMMRSKDFARDYGVLLTDGPLAGLTARAVLVLDEQDQIIYTELVTEITSEPNYAQAIAALKQ
ncbi:thiol peroxidase [Motiliproteus sp. MSK22-1]|uniref:thiol peroxidase n=1 Tax=Motiliproteus sp. MSK22-1 TaxID=1897630 RepID=UPI0009781C03|nr:thiol peroxidase [Motiliproteus sp. MSK22-1]OMH29170.1 lipid hydroperoxide peroxidase [Motiliproteus sp. MSK22-1]